MSLLTKLAVGTIAVLGAYAVKSRGGKATKATSQREGAAKQSKARKPTKRRSTAKRVKTA